MTMHGTSQKQTRQRPGRLRDRTSSGAISKCQRHTAHSKRYQDQVQSGRVRVGVELPGELNVMARIATGQEAPHDEVNGASSADSNFPPEFYDTLSKVWLTHRALREFDRRNRLQTSQKSTQFPGLRRLTNKPPNTANLRRFSRTGGPDLQDLRGYHPPIPTVHTMTFSPAKSSRSFSEWQRCADRPPESTTNNTSPSSRPGDCNFEQKCVDCRIYPVRYRLSNNKRVPNPANLEEICQNLERPNDLLSWPAVCEEAFEDFLDYQTNRFENTKVVETLAGTSDCATATNIPFPNLASITDGTTNNPKPDFFDGAHSRDVERKVRHELNKVIVPNTTFGTPLAPNFFLESKGSKGKSGNATMQAMLAGAHGALIMHQLQNFHRHEAIYDGKAYAFSATLVDGHLKLYAHHLVAPDKPGETPSYFMTLIEGYSVETKRNFFQGAQAFRILRAKAKGYRDTFISTANQRALGGLSGGETAREIEPSGTTRQQDGDSTSIDLTDSPEVRVPEDELEPTTPTTNTGPLCIQSVQNEHKAKNAHPKTNFETSFENSTVLSVYDAEPLLTDPSKVQRSPPSPSSPRKSKKRDLN